MHKAKEYDIGGNHCKRFKLSQKDEKYRTRMGCDVKTLDTDHRTSSITVKLENG